MNLSLKESMLQLYFLLTQNNTTMVFSLNRSPLCRVKNLHIYKEGIPLQNLAPRLDSINNYEM